MLVADLRRVVRVHADAGIDPIVGLGQRDTATHLIRPAAVADRQEPANTGIPSALKHRVTVIIEPGIIEMRMRVDKHKRGTERPQKAQKAQKKKD
jgi:hypothetical protein